MRKFNVVEYAIIWNSLPTYNHKTHCSGLQLGKWLQKFWDLFSFNVNASRTDAVVINNNKA